MKYLKKFATEAGVMMFVQPNVALAEDTGAVLYNVDSSGVYIQHIDGTLLTTDQWEAGGYTNDLANGVAVCTPEAQFVIAKEDISTDLAWSSNTGYLVSGIVTTTDSTIAKTDYAGAANTALIAAIDTSKAAYSCANYAFLNGAKGHLPSLGEWAIAYANKSKVVEAMTLIGGTAMANSYYWSSTQSDGSNAWSLFWGAGGTSSYAKRTTSHVRAFSAL